MRAHYTKHRKRRVDFSPWNVVAPPQNRCAICYCSHVKHEELRPTGPKGHIQVWRFCDRCWQEHVAWTKTPIAYYQLAHFFRKAEIDPGLMGLRVYHRKFE